ncbi:MULTISPECIES: molybdenum cofactor guanylyltransferase [Halorubrum]|uniref:Molybdopterin-guanine dinucleotide biosynthesis protein A n=1 Tax=Halorubrum sodomense TaxID=35743 RepID=A0A1I6FLL8_HALSD|nr:MULTISPECIES: molybdenum cofactor guanylyltransferase [Halorubrum]TKX54628.1 molybdenum cofactor guanylyltransferase [Halorubrum sp. SP3]TKX70972.1 molybdenum cofactor guanylyltransferase [Halorubrum sp. SP9]SFR30842.1 molybdopterin-guanine dinucleotide biosynthesis protein A [Halorubrum sodomense]
MTTGAILAGGRSTRFGDADKAVAELAGVPMIRRVADRLAGADDPVPPGADRAAGGDPVVDELVVNCRPDQREAIAEALAGFPLPVRWALDDEPDLGPLAGIRNACRAATDPYAVVVACDMPFVDPGFLDHLREAAADAEAAVPRLEDRWYQTTQAAYATGPAAAACDRALNRGERKVLALVDRVDEVVVGDEAIRSLTTERTFTNVNTREERDDAERAIAAAVDAE